MNRSGLKVLKSLKTFKNCKDELFLLPIIYFSNKLTKSNIEHITIIISILFQLSLKYEPSSMTKPKAQILIKASRKKMKLKTASKISKTITVIYPAIIVSRINLAVEAKIINKINLSNHLALINLRQNILNLLV